MIGPVAHSYGGTALKDMVQGRRRSGSPGAQGGQGQQPSKGVRTGSGRGKAVSVCTLAASYLLRTSLTTGRKGKNCIGSGRIAWDWKKILEGRARPVTGYLQGKPGEEGRKGDGGFFLGKAGEEGRTKLLR